MSKNKIINVNTHNNQNIILNNNKNKENNNNNKYTIKASITNIIEGIFRIIDVIINGKYNR